MSKSRPVRPTRRQKEIIDSLRLTTENYLVCTETENTITLYNKYTGKTITRYKKGAKSE
jgi:hypothetical protein